MDLEKTNAIISLLDGHIRAFNKLLNAVEYAEEVVAGGFMPVTVFNCFIPFEREAVDTNMITEHDVRLELLKCAKDVADMRNVAQMFKALVEHLDLKRMSLVCEGIMGRIIKCKESWESWMGYEKKEFSFKDLQDYYVVLRNLQRWEKAFNDIYKQLGGIDIWEEEGSSCKADGIKTEEKLPDALKTPKAVEMFEKLVEAGYLDNTYKPTSMLNTRNLKVITICAISKKLNIKNKWKVFESYWELSSLAPDKQKLKDLGFNTDAEEKLFERLQEILDITMDITKL